jgi:5-hydroxyisourate hydrolase-like protein (transthyretin family)
MNTTLHFFAGSVQLDEVMDIVGNVDERDMYGFGFFGNFYLGLYYDSIGEREMAKTFLQFSQSSKRYPEKDMWYHIPRVLYTARGFDEEDDSQGDL